MSRSGGIKTGHYQDYHLFEMYQRIPIHDFSLRPETISILYLTYVIMLKCLVNKRIQSASTPQIIL